MSDELPELTDSEYRALKIAARQSPEGRRAARIEKHPLGRQYVNRLTGMGLLDFVNSGRRQTLEITPLGLEVMRSYWVGDRRPLPYDQQGKQK